MIPKALYHSTPGYRISTPVFPITSVFMSGHVCFTQQSAFLSDFFGCSPRLRVSAVNSCLSDVADFAPPRPFFYFLLQTNTLFESTQAWPLHGAWVALGPRLGHPRATQSQTQSPAESHRQRVATPKCENPASSRVKLLVWHSRSRLCVLTYLLYHFFSLSQ